MTNILIVGATGFGREVYCWAKDTFDKNEYNIKGFISKDNNDLEGFNIDIPILGDEFTYEIEENDRFILALGNIDIKKKVVNALKDRGAKFISLIHPTSIITPTAKIGEGVVICPYCIISDNAIISDFVMMNLYASVGHDSVVGKWSVFAPYSTVNGFVTIEEEVYLATHSCVVAKKKVGFASKVSANSVAGKNVPPYSLAYGVPCQIMRNYYKE